MPATLMARFGAFCRYLSQNDILINLFVASNPIKWRGLSQFVAVWRSLSQVSSVDSPSARILKKGFHV